MDPEPITAKSVFLNALEISDRVRRQTYVAEQCGSDDALRRDVERLLQHHAAKGSFLESPAGPETATAELPVNSVKPGAVIGPYKLLEQIGEGGFGVVFMAEQIHPVRRKVALKVIKPGMDSNQVVARFEAERQALAMMDHVNIARVIDGGTTEAGRPYFVMELVHGVPITKYCDDNHLTPRERLELFVPVCQAIQHAHQKGIIHRDVKPSNVMITLYDGKPMPKVIDFGVAKATEQTLTSLTLFTNYGTMVGTLEYMSPEQAEMSALGVDTRSDIYSLGVLLYELLTGSTPLTHKRMKEAAYTEILRMIKEEEPPKPSTRLSSSGAALASISANRHMEPAKLTNLMRGELDWIVMKTLEKDRNRRYETAKDFAADVQRYLRDEAVQACPPSVGYRLRKFVRRNKGPVLAATLVVMTLVGGIIGTTWGMIRATDARVVAVDEANQKKAALEAAQESERDAKDQLFLALWNTARASRFSRHMGQRLDSLAALGKAAHIRPDAGLRDEAIAAMSLPDVRRAPGWNSSPPATLAVAYGRQYRLYARMDEPKIISIRTIPEDREVQRIASGPILGSYLHFSPDDRFLLGLEDGYALRVWRVADGQSILRDDLRGCRAHAFSSDSRQLAIGQQDSVLCFDLATGHEVKKWCIPASAHTLAFHPDNRKLAVGYENYGNVSVYDSASGALLADLTAGAMFNQVVAWHPHGDRLAVAGSDPRIQIWNVAAKRRVATLEGHVQRIAAVTFHPDGNLLASHGWDGMLLLWDPSCGRELMRLPSVSAPHFSPDGRWLGVAWGGKSADLLEVTPSREYRTLVGSAGVGSNNHGDISPDGRLLAMGMDTGACLWDLPSGRELAALPAGTVYVSFDVKGDNEGSPVTSNSPRWSLLTSGLDGLMRWPVTSDDLRGKRLRLGPPRQISTLARAWFARGPAGRTLGVVTEEYGANKILDLETGTVRRELGVHPRGDVQALSGDGRWAASCGWHSDHVRLWSAATGEMVHEWVLGKRTLVFFTPDSKALVISRGDEVSFWDVETLQPFRRLPREVVQFPGHVAFTQDGRLLALEMAPAVVHLIEASSGRTVAKLEDPHGDRAGWIGFTPDGTQLVVAAPFAKAIHVWDLRAMRERLKGMGLDWDWPEFRPADPKATSAEPVKVELLAGVLAKVELTPEQGARQAVKLNPKNASAQRALGNALLDQKKPVEAVAAFRRSIELDPNNSRAHYRLGVALRDQHKLNEAIAAYRRAIEVDPKNAIAYIALGGALRDQNKVDEAIDAYRAGLRLEPDNARFNDLLAWLLVTRDDAKLRDPKRAVELAKKAVQLEPMNGLYQQTLGYAEYRAGNWKSAIMALEQVKDLGSPGDSLEWFPLAMAHWQLGDKQTAYKWYDKAVEWLEKNQPKNEELLRLRAEAAELLGVEKKKG